MKYQWYPGHMAKARRMMEESIRLVDVVIEIVDARCPASSRNPDIDRMAAGKGRIIILNKADLADPGVTDLWSAYFRVNGIACMSADARRRISVRNLTQMTAKVCEERNARRRAKGMNTDHVRAMIAGIPNVGKSTWINSLSGRASAKTGNKPGVTRGGQWIAVGTSFELLDTPGILWPGMDREQTGRNLALTGSMRDEAINIEELALELITFLLDAYPGVLAARYGIDESGQEEETRDDMILRPDTSPNAIRCMDDISAWRAFMKKGGGIDYDRTARALLDDFRSGRLGRISLEKPPVKENQ
ncbi:MAG: ribosome biogenesis GTPase YlqF [Lachnospiraceae bacterium]|jgi:ribosome biogenesis GTPase A|nr:ribosome biogenesis GTPase YlqF [Lachnospiraceae bacterium]MCI1301877.1 ribosome biogenesis GTPase YlqF [Lachnospiraceae bacterium]MCI1332724.1 ribosome biogenesis GTPase YlqF [Lachnospiraceae bacterium]